MCVCVCGCVGVSKCFDGGPGVDGKGGYVLIYKGVCVCVCALRDRVCV